MANRQFSDRVNSALDDMGFPARQEERRDALAKSMKIKKFQAESILNGNIASTNNNDLIERLAEELEVSSDWLIGASDTKKSSFHP